MGKEHFLEQHDPERKEFQIDRIILFTDAVFAIAITLLVIEIKAPHIQYSFTNADALDQLKELIPKFFGFILSFIVIAIYWRSHHRMFGFVSSYSNRVIFLNFFFLFTLILMPFSSAYYGENAGRNIPYCFYNINIILIGIASYSLAKCILNPKNKLIAHQPTVAFKKLFLARAITVPIIFLLGVLLVPYFPVFSRWIPIFVWPAFAVLTRIHKRAHRVKTKNKTEDVVEND